MSKHRDHTPPRPGDKLWDINGYPDNRGLPTVRVVCEGRRDRGTGHEECVIATFGCGPFDPRAECGNWFWDSDAAVGGGPRHPTTRLREDKSTRLATQAEKDAGWRWDVVEVEPKAHVGTLHTGGILHLACPRCSLDLRLREAALREYLDAVMKAELDLDDEAVALLQAAGRKLPLLGLIARQTKPKG